jgi:hypothetical protein
VLAAGVLPQRDLPAEDMHLPLDVHQGLGLAGIDHTASSHVAEVALIEARNDRQHQTNPSQSRG